MTDYNHDGHAWAIEQADAIRRRSSNEIDWENVAEEIESLGKQLAGELKSRYVVLITHLLKWMLQPQRRGTSWELTILQQRLDIEDHLAENPSLKSRDAEVFARAYRSARLQAAREMRRSPRSVPLDPPFTLEQAKLEDFWPD